MNGGFKKDLPLMIGDYVLMIGFAAFVMGKRNLGASQGSLAIVAVGMVGLGVGAAFGLGSLYGARV
jgi:hypothetical protein